jgi:hypothetical protein
MSNAVLVGPADKARYFEDTAKRLDEAGAPDDSAELRTAAQTEWEKLGLLSRDTSLD